VAELPIPGVGPWGLIGGIIVQAGQSPFQHPGTDPAFGGSSSGASPEDVVASGILSSPAEPSQPLPPNTPYPGGPGGNADIPPITFPPGGGAPYQEYSPPDYPDEPILIPVPPAGSSDYIPPTQSPGAMPAPREDAQPPPSPGDTVVRSPEGSYFPYGPQARMRKGKRRPTEPRIPGPPYDPRGFSPGNVLGPYKVQLPAPRREPPNPITRPTRPPGPTPYPRGPAPNEPGPPLRRGVPRPGVPEPFPFRFPVEIPPLILLPDILRTMIPPPTSPFPYPVEKAPPRSAPPSGTPPPPGRTEQPTRPALPRVPPLPSVSTPEQEPPKWPIQQPSPSSFPVPRSVSLPSPVPPAQPVSTSTPSRRTTPIVTPSRLFAAVGPALSLLNLLRPSPRHSGDRSPTQLVQPSPTPTPSSPPSSSPQPTPQPGTTPAPGSTPAPQVTPQAPPGPNVGPQGALSPTASSAPQGEACETPRQTQQRRKAQRMECRKFITIRVPAHKRRVCASEAGRIIGKRLGKALGRKIGEAVGLRKARKEGATSRHRGRHTERPVRVTKHGVDVFGVGIELPHEMRPKLRIPKLPGTRQRP